MANHKVVICCWFCGQESDFVMNKRQEETLERKIKKGLAVCPRCRDVDHVNRPVFIKAGETLFSTGKVYRCEHGHAHVIAAFANGVLNVEFGPGQEDFVNIDCKPDELAELIDTKDISCYHVINGQSCDGKLSAVDDERLECPVAPGIKTKTRLGDLWDKHNITPVRQGKYNKDGEYSATQSEKANRHRLQRMRERNVPVNKLPGKIMDKPTNKKYSRRPKSDIDFS